MDLKQLAAPHWWVGGYADTHDGALARRGVRGGGGQAGWDWGPADWERGRRERTDAGQAGEMIGRGMRRV